MKIKTKKKIVVDGKMLFTVCHINIWHTVKKK